MKQAILGKKIGDGTQLFREDGTKDPRDRCSGRTLPVTQVKRLSTTATMPFRWHSSPSAKKPITKPQMGHSQEGWR